MKLYPIALNQNEVEVNDVTILFSYKTPVACHIVGEGFFKTEKKWSKTTSKHINQFITRNGGTPEKVQEKPQEFFDNLGK